MKHIFLSLLILSAIIYPLLILTSCNEEELRSEEKTFEDRPVTAEETGLESYELEQRAEEAREMLIESLKETASNPHMIRGINGDNVNLNASEDTTEANENSEVLI
ncbi:hypothetical protein DYE50_11760 [Treponema ruminis]|uniref:hypothetical protein n=1 Tax=Treponema ruminis TaxID=744515 RepID=UPI001980E5D2|nr:hypothetical protein [Treponema ruminis]QSI03241.1 hypothetical protein DYE50_11760 [Treponema ruminis]